MVAESENLPQNLLIALQRLVQALEQHQLRYALIGAVASGYRSRPRATQDLDFLLEVPQISLPGLLEDLQASGFSFDMLTAIRQWTQEHLAVMSFRGIRVDWLKPVLPCYQHVLNDARPEVWHGTTIRIASPEGLILLKLLAFRSRDLLDIENLLAANRGQLDLDYVRREWESLADENDPRMRRFNELVEKFYLSH
jgi:hypothetical protein